MTISYHDIVMHTLILCLFIACLLPYLARIPVAFAMKNQPGGYDNHYPRTQQASLTGFGARATASQLNGFESLIIFSSAILTAIATQHTSYNIQEMAILYVIIRAFYHIFYLMNWATLRSIAWLIGYVSSLSILFGCL